jgi:hypothetical protein
LANLTALNLRDTFADVDILVHFWKLTKLTSLDLSRNNIWGIEYGGRLDLGALTALTSLNLLFSSCDDLDMEELVPELRKLTRLTFLGLGGKFTHSKVAPLEVEFESRGALLVTGKDYYSDLIDSVSD